MKKEPEGKAAGLILAAGSSTRMGYPKQLLKAGTGNLLEHIINETLKSDLEYVITVLGSRAGEIREAINKERYSEKLEIIENRDWENGISSSIITGIAHMRDSYDHCMMILADMPYISSGIINHLLHRYLDSGLKIGAINTGKRSHPVIFNRALYDDLCGLKGDIGARFLFEKYPDEVCMVKPEEAFNDLDLDTPDDYLKYRNSINGRPETGG